MSRHGNPVRIYATNRLRWLTPLCGPGAKTAAWVATALAITATRVVVFVSLEAAGALAVGVGLLWVTLWAARSTTSVIIVADRYHAEMIDKACATIVEHLPTTAGLRRAEVLAVTRDAQWQLACLMRDQSRLATLKQLTHESLAALCPDDPLHAELVDRESALDAQLHCVKVEFDQRLERLNQLASHSAALAMEAGAGERMRAATERARHALDDADSGLAETAAWSARTDPTAELADQAQAVLSAYRELNDVQ